MPFLTPRSTMRLIAMCISVGLPVIAGSSIANGQCQIAKLVDLAGGENDRFGSAVAIDGDVAVVGITHANHSGVRGGSAFVYRLERGVWNREAILTASDAADGDQFGDAVDVSGTVIVVGAFGNDHAGASSGAVYVYRFDGVEWIEEAKLTASDAAEGDWFGRDHVTIDGDTALVGARHDDDRGRDSGSVYVFRFNGANWIRQAKLLASDGESGDNFGGSVTISGDLAFIGAIGDDDFANNSGAAYAFERRNGIWTQQAKIVASIPAERALFGVSVSTDGRTALIGAGREQDSTGAAYIFGFDGTVWVEQARLTASDASPASLFGWRVSVDGDIAVVGAEQEDSGGFGNAGAAYVYRLDGGNWVEVAKLTPQERMQRQWFGTSVSVDGERVMIGAHLDSSVDHYAGAAYAFHLSDPCDMNCDGAVDVFDIEPFLDLLFGGANPCAPCTGDTNEDGVIDRFDVDLFLACLFP